MTDEIPTGVTAHFSIAEIAARIPDASTLRSWLKRSLPDYLSSGQILVGCEGNDESLGYLAKQVGRWSTTIIASCTFSRPAVSRTSASTRSKRA